MNKYTFENEWMRQRAEYLETHGYPACEKDAPMTKDEVENLKVGTICYIFSPAGVRLGMFSYHDKKGCENHKLAFYVHGGTDTYKVKNVGKTYNLYRAHVV